MASAGMILAGPLVATAVFFYTPFFLNVPPDRSLIYMVGMGYAFGALPSIVTAVAWWIFDAWARVRLWPPLAAAIIGAIVSFAFEALALRVILYGYPFDIIIFLVVSKLALGGAIAAGASVWLARGAAVSARRRRTEELA